MLRFKRFLQEGVNDPAIFKAVFLAGGPGSGKSFIVGKTAITSHGFKVVNSDDAFERAMEKAMIRMDAEGIFSPKGQEAREKAKRITRMKQDRYLAGRLGLVIDGTGKDFAKIKKQSSELRKLGYETAMIFVNTDEETALKRNRMRPRSLPDAEVSKMWGKVQTNIGKFQGHFGKNFLVIDNSTEADMGETTMHGYKWAKKFADRKVSRPVAKKWIEKERSKK